MNKKRRDRPAPKPLVAILCGRCGRRRKTWDSEDELPVDVDRVRVNPCDCDAGIHKPNMVEFGEIVPQLDGLRGLYLRYQYVHVESLRKHMRAARRLRKTQYFRL
jgi:NAD-dependent SIR2 family protein deacetylase